MLDGVGIVVAAALVAVKYLRKGNDGLAASFLVPSAGYPFLVLAFVGWIQTLLAPGVAPGAREDVVVAAIGAER